MGFLQLKFFIFLLFSAVCPTICDQTLTCGNNSFFIQYPFRLLQEGQKPHHKTHHYVLKCNSQGFVVLNLPSSGDFYVRDIDYFDQKIQIYDPGNCLARRMKNFSLSSSPFVARTFQNYTFFRCPAEVLSSRTPSVISCLSNSTASILAASLLSMADEIRNLTSCKVIYSLQIPVSSPFQLDNGDLELAWSDPSCKGDCKGGSTSKSVLGIIVVVVVIISIALLGTLFCIGCCLSYASMIVENNEANSRTSYSSGTRVWEITRITLSLPWLRPQPLAPSVSTASEDKFSTEDIIIGGRQCISGPNSDSCRICLEEYEASERLRRLCECNHCFHADCLEKWLQRETTCPICRTSVIL